MRLPLDQEIRRILIVDDDTGFVTLVRSHLAAGTFALDSARDAREALDFVKRSTHPYDVALIDLWLPSGRGKNYEAQPYLGFQLAEQIATASPSTKLIAISFYGNRETTFHNSGRFSEFIDKTELAKNPTILSSHLDGRTPQPEGMPGANRFPANEQTVSGQEWPWVAVASLSALGAGILPVIFVLLPQGLPRFCLLLAAVTFVTVLCMNPRRRYFKAFSAVLGVWGGATIVPALGLRFEGPHFLLTFFVDGPPAIFHFTAALIMLALLFLDSARYSGKRDRRDQK